MCVCKPVCVRKREREREWERVCVYVCVRERTEAILIKGELMRCFEKRKGLV